MKIVALVPMKAHSSRVPEKNFKMFAGKPLYHWILDTLLEVAAVDLIVINTDAKKVLGNSEIRNNPQIMVRERREDLRGDFVSMNKVIEDDIKEVEADLYIMTHTTNPLLSSATISEALDTIIGQSEHDSLFSVNRTQTRFYHKDGTPVNHDPRNLVRTQDLEPWFEENSNLYLFTRKSFYKTQARIGETPILFETPRIESVDIDDEEDWMIAESIAKFYNKS